MTLLSNKRDEWNGNLKEVDFFSFQLFTCTDNLNIFERLKKIILDTLLRQNKNFKFIWSEYKIYFKIWVFLRFLNDSKLLAEN